MWPIANHDPTGKDKFFRKIPLCIITSDADTQEFLAQVAGLLGDRVYQWMMSSGSGFILSEPTILWTTWLFYRGIIYKITIWITK